MAMTKFCNLYCWSKSAWTDNQLTLFAPAFFSTSKDRGGPPLNILGLGGVTVSILFEYDLLWNDSPYSKIYMKFGCLEPSNIMFDFCDLGLVFVVVLCFRLFQICVFVRFVFVLKAVRIAARVVYERELL